MSPVIFQGFHKCRPRSIVKVTAGAVYRCHCGRYWVMSWLFEDYWTPLRWWHFRARSALNEIGEVTK